MSASSATGRQQQYPHRGRDSGSAGEQAERERDGCADDSAEAADGDGGAAPFWQRVVEPRLRDRVPAGVEQAERREQDELRRETGDEQEGRVRREREERGDADDACAGRPAQRPEAGASRRRALLRSRRPRRARPSTASGRPRRRGRAQGSRGRRRAADRRPRGSAAGVGPRGGEPRRVRRGRRDRAAARSRAAGSGTGAWRA